MTPHQRPHRSSVGRGRHAANAVFVALAFAGCLLTRAEFDPPLVESAELTPDASVAPSGCVTAADCTGGDVCVDATCVPPPPGVDDGDAGVAPPCVGSDCPSEVPLPLAPSCEDGVLNGEETGVDCGGTCGGCSAGAACAVAADCESGVCGDAGTCPAPSCEDGVVNQDESDVDCGGACERDCGTGERCRVDADCEPGAFCPAGAERCAPASCADAVQNGDEVGADCGGACPGCLDGSACNLDGDCASGVCTAGTCAAPACDDGALNRDETDTDCGGDCPSCPVGGDCIVNGDCSTGVCRAGTCAPPACNDNVQNGNETDVDCGGNCFQNCSVGEGCNNGNDCQTGSCNAVGCGPGLDECCQAPSCNDNVQNGTETAVDCGNAACGPCPVGSPCAVDAQCELQFCQQGECEDPGTCSDGVLNGRELFVDCGGADCPLCPDLSECNQDADCINNNCDPSGVCISCGDGVRNGTETSVDCGGADAACRRCNAGEGCGSNDDCNFLLCIGGVCS